MIVGLADVLLQTERQSILTECSLAMSASIVYFISCSIKILTTVIKFLVKVPVLSEQMLLAPPMVSQA